MKSKPNTKPAKTKELKTKVKLSSKTTGKSKSVSAVTSKVVSKSVTKVKVKAQAGSAQTKTALLKSEKAKKLPVKAGLANKSAAQKTSEKKLLSGGKRTDNSSDVVISTDKSRGALDVKKSAPKPTSRRLGQVVETKQRKTASPSSIQPVAPAADSTKKRPIQVTQTVSNSASSAPSAAPSKTTRPSARLSQVTVPSIAQAVASTAAKASYMPVQPEVVISPPLPSALKKDAKLANNWKTKPVGELSDAELQAMPDSEYMNAVQLAAFRLRLMALRRDILSSAGETTEHLREDTSVVPDPADRATIEEEHALELRTRDRERKLLKKIEQAIERIDANDYGYCDETGEPIGVGRLLARPTATLSLEAQQRRELKQKMFGD